MPLEGTLKDMSLPNLVQLQCSENKRARITLTRRNVQGALVVDAGELVHAMAGPLTGENAVYELLAWDEGNFQVNDSLAEVPTRNVNTPWQSLVLEGLRRSDEVKSERIQAFAQASNFVQAAPAISEWHLCAIDGREITQSGESIASPIADWVANVLREGVRIGQDLGIGDLAEIVLSNPKQKRILVPRERYWLVVVTTSNTAMSMVRDALARGRAR
jgi:predicted regulator of Ras-like GTPase activity (Roadblock/LC7/MglB family)